MRYYSEIIISSCTCKPKQNKRKLSPVVRKRKSLGRYIHYVQCPNCNASSMPGNSKKEAIKAWNEWNSNPIFLIIIPEKKIPTERSKIMKAMLFDVYPALAKMEIEIDECEIKESKYVDAIYLVKKTESFIKEKMELVWPPA